MSSVLFSLPKKPYDISAQTGGSIINISSVASIATLANASVYSASKAAWTL
jgi:short-subunit dehydrogenase